MPGPFKRALCQRRSVQGTLETEYDDSLLRKRFQLCCRIYALTSQTTLPTEEAFEKLSLALQYQIHIVCVQTVFEMLRIVPHTLSQGGLVLITKRYA